MEADTPIRPKNNALADLLAVAFIVITMLLLVRAIPTARANSPNDTCIKNGYRVLSALGLYVQDYDERLPFLGKGPEPLRPYIYPSSPEFTRCPVTRAPYNWNLALSGYPLWAIENQDTVTVMEDRVPHPDRRKMVAFLDFHVEYGGKDARGLDAGCIDHIKQLTRSMLMYAQDYDEKLPALNNLPKLMQQILPYTDRSADFLRCPITSKWYLWNSAYAGVALAAIQRPAATAAVQDASPHSARGGVSVGFFDGHAEFDGKEQPPVIVPRPETVTLGNAKQVALGVMMYVQDYDEVFPPMNNYQRFMTCILPYVKNEELFFCPPD